MPSGVNIVTPVSHKGLAKNILETGGCLVSEYEPNVKASRSDFVERDAKRHGEGADKNKSKVLWNNEDSYCYREIIRYKSEVGMNIQIFGSKKDNDTKKAQRFFKERGIRFQYIDLREKTLSKGEFRSVAAVNGGLEGKDSEKL